jgi:hypothetical protein
MNTSRTCRALGALSVCAILTAVAAAGYSEPVTSDFNRDGNPDAWSYFSGDKIEKQEIDINYDGKIDTVYLYDGEGKVAEEALDTNYDGKIDNWRTYKNGKIVLDKVDSNLDGRVDLWIYVDKGGIYRIEKDVDGDGKPDDTSAY